MEQYTLSFSGSMIDSLLTQVLDNNQKWKSRIVALLTHGDSLGFIQWGLIKNYSLVAVVGHPHMSSTPNKTTLWFTPGTVQEAFTNPGSSTRVYDPYTWSINRGTSSSLSNGAIVTLFVDNAGSPSGPDYILPDTAHIKFDVYPTWNDSQQFDIEEVYGVVLGDV